MDKPAIDTREKLIHRVFPDLRYGGDPDIERYFELRKTGRVQEALSVYHGRLRVRYPDDGKRFALLAAFRARDPRFADFLLTLLLELADAMIVRIRANIDILAACFDGVDLRNMYRALKAVEAVVRYLPPDSDDAIAALDRYSEFSELLDYRAERMERVRFLTREFFAQSGAEDPEDWNFLERGRRMEEDRRAAARKNFFDLSKIEFAPEDVERIEIPSRLSRKEDRVLAFCYKYWTGVDDPGFERIVFLFSRKYGTHHYDIFRVVKNARARKHNDDEMLNMVSTVMSSRYSYSVQGDRYMQLTWRRLKVRLLGEIELLAADSANAAAIVPAEAADRYAGGKAVWRLPAPKAPATLKPVRLPAPIRSAPVAGPQVPAAAFHVVARQVIPFTETVPGRRPAESSAPPAPERPPVRVAPRKDERPVMKILATGARMLAARAKTEIIPRPVANGSVSDRIKKLSGRSYDVYRELFLARVRESIRKHLSSGNGNGKSSSPDSALKAEDLIFEFLERNYANPYMDWEDSDERARLGALGFGILAIDPVIEHCYRRL
ncbi:MAG: hypothetical protein NT080_11070 [Spirochaetes bacterium]|nr:hypothetical protein [Spirochaetota bacterium]